MTVRIGVSLKRIFLVGLSGWEDIAVVFNPFVNKDTTAAVPIAAAPAGSITN